ncbi:DMT family transporter [Ferrovibrio sp.]|uniref:DMT family transporter n=1 Tax=Ferrovibrio sp. TaxID=1917215 RepID=UPI001B4875E9|nr:DMT family transporter [Ferrovibrio sp.]MBP7065283.1 DMT family transporter [Ferrovibrio sp.]
MTDIPSPNTPAGTLPLGVLLRGLLWAGTTVAIFSGWFVVTRFGMAHHMGVWDVMALRFGGGALLLMPVLLLPAHRLPARAWAEGLLLAVLWGGPFVYLVALGLQLTSVAQVATTTPPLMPVFAGLIGWWLLREKPGLPRLIGYGVIIAGIATLFVSQLQARGMPRLDGVVVLILAAILWALYTLRFRRSGLNAIQAAALICFWSALFFLPVYYFAGLSHLNEAPMQALVFQMVYQGCLMSAVAIVTFNRAVTLLGAGAAAAIIALIPCLATLLAVPFLGEVPSLVDAMATGAIALGVIFAARPTPSKPAQTAP